MMRISVAPEVMAQFPEMSLGVVYGTLHSTRPDYPGTIAELRSSALERLNSRGLESILAAPSLQAWRHAYEKFGMKAKKYPPTHEALARRLIKSQAWPNINPVVDIYLSNQAYHLLPHGGYDATTLAGDLLLDLSPGGEPFEPLGGGSETTDPGEVIYRDAERVLTRRWNYRDCDKAKITPETRQFLLMIESPDSTVPVSQVSAACEDLAERYRRCFEGSFAWAAQEMVHSPGFDLPPFDQSS
jgi:DNA/RNA-binding domain of Phe-tRNA-synthetase-like protein